VINPHFGQFSRDGKQNNGVISDIFLHGGNQNSRDNMEMVKRGLLKYVSVEHGGEEVYNTAIRAMEAKTLVFSGLAVVRKGACKACTIHEKEAVMEAEFMEMKEMEDKIASLTKELEAVKAKPAEAKVEIPKELTEMPGQIKELMDLVKAQAAQIKALEQDGTPKTGAGQTKELAEPPRRIIVSRTGEVYAV
jgi:hypothetical protein